MKNANTFLGFMQAIMSRGMGVACRLLDDWRIVLDIAILDPSQIFDTLSNIHVA